MKLRGMDPEVEQKILALQLPEREEDITLEQLDRLWEILAAIPLSEDDNGNTVLNRAFLHFLRHTTQTEVWHWFDTRYPDGLGARHFPDAGAAEFEMIIIATLSTSRKMTAATLDGLEMKLERYYEQEDFSAYEIDDHEVRRKPLNDAARLLLAKAWK